MTIKILSFLKGDKDCSAVIMDKSDYHRVIEEDINNGVYTQTNYTTLKDIKLRLSFFNRNFKNYEIMKKCISNPPAIL